MPKMITQDTWIPISLAILLASGAAYIRGIDKDVIAAQEDVRRHDIIMESIPIIQKDIEGIRSKQEEMSKRLDRIGDFLSKLRLGK